MEKRLAFPHGRTLLAVRLAYVAPVVALLVVALAVLPPLPPAPLAAVVAVVAAYIVLFVLSPLGTEHWLTRSRLILRQGLYFRAIVPIAEIETIEPAEIHILRVPLGIHRPLSQPALFVTGGRSGLIRIRLVAPRRFWQAFGLLAREIVFDVDDPRRFLDAFEERRRLFAPVEPDRSDA